MFAHLVESKRTGAEARRKTYFFVWSAAGWLAAVTFAAILGIWIADIQLAAAAEVTRLLVPPPPPAPPMGGTEAVRRPTGGRPAVNPVVAPTEIAREVTSTPARNLPETVENSSIGSLIPHGEGIVGGVPGGDGKTVGGSGDGPSDPPPPPDPPKREESKPIRQSEGVIRGNAIDRVTPDYPPLAKAAGARGDVVVELTISEEGHVLSARVISGHPLLQSTALNAARRWRFNPTKLNGTAVQVTGILTFRFTL